MEPLRDSDIPYVVQPMVWPAPRPKFQDRVWVHTVLLLLTIATTTIAGAEHYAAFVADFRDGPLDSGGRFLDFTGKYVLHIERGPEWWAVDADGKEGAGWRSWMGVGDVRYGSAPKESTLEVVASLDALRDKVPPELFEMVARSARQPTVEELDI